jgi:hypothetical protein
LIGTALYNMIFGDCLCKTLEKVGSGILIHHNTSYNTMNLSELYNKIKVFMFICVYSNTPRVRVLF